MSWSIRHISRDGPDQPSSRSATGVQGADEPIADSALTWLTCGRTFPATQKCRFGVGRIASARLAGIMLLI
jgi:hypothetical protein